MFLYDLTIDMHTLMNAHTHVHTCNTLVMVVSYSIYIRSLCFIIITMLYLFTFECSLFT